MNTNEMFAHDMKIDAFRKFALNKDEYVTNVCKEVISECASRLYMSSLIFENASELESTIKPIAFECFMETMSDCNSIDDIKVKFKNASPYIKSAVSLAESISEKHDPVVCVANKAFLLTESENNYIVYRNAAVFSIEADTLDEAVQAFNDGKGNPEPDKTIKEFSKKELLDPIDYSTITAWEKDIGKDIYDNAMRDRLMKVFDAENSAVDKQRERLQQITDTLTSFQPQPAPEDPGVNMDPNGVNDANSANGANTNPAVVESAIGFIKSTPKSLFNAILINKSKVILRESGTGASITDYAEDIMKEAISTYAIYECIHSLGMHTYSDSEKRELISTFNMGAVQ